MGKLGRFACIFTPMILSFISLVMILLVFLGGRNKGDGNLRSIYFFSANTTAFQANGPEITGLLSKADANTKKFIEGLVGQVKANNLKDLYYVHMWNFCTATATGANGTSTKDYTCSSPKAQYYFNPIVEWGLNGTTAQKVIPGAIDKALSVYQKGAQWLFIAYAIAFFSTIATIVVGFFALCSRIGSCVTSIVSGIATLFTILSAITATILFSTLVGALDTLLKPYKIDLTVGTKMLAIEWIGVAFSVAASLFWFVSICCCSGRSSGGKGNSKGPEPGFTPFANRGTTAYQPLGDNHQHQANPYASQYGGQPSNVEMQSFGGAGPYKGRETTTAYEPFRSRDV